MSAGCDHHDHGEVGFEGRSAGFRRALWIVLALNAGMFIVETVAGAFAGSKALQADALDFAADSATYALSLAVIGMPLVWRARSALLKSASLAVMAAWVFGTTVHRSLVGGVPDEAVMGTIGVLALGANVAAALILMRHRDGDANVRSVWLCTRNDAIGNVAVVVAAGAVAITATKWPDLIVAAAMAGLFLSSAIGIARRAVGEIRSVPPHAIGGRSVARDVAN